MGNAQELSNFSSFINTEKYISNTEKIAKSNFKFLEKIGRGGFSQVWKVLYLKYCSNAITTENNVILAIKD